MWLCLLRQNFAVLTVLKLMEAVEAVGQSTSRQGFTMGRHVRMGCGAMQGKTYKNKALSALFLMNNVHYLVKAVESSPALAVIGEDWIELHRDQACFPLSLSLSLSLPLSLSLSLPLP